MRSTTDARWAITVAERGSSTSSAISPISSPRLGRPTRRLPTVTAKRPPRTRNAASPRLPSLIRTSPGATFCSLAASHSARRTAASKPAKSGWPVRASSVPCAVASSCPWGRSSFEDAPGPARRRWVDVPIADGDPDGATPYRRAHAEPMIRTVAALATRRHVSCSSLPRWPFPCWLRGARCQRDLSVGGFVDSSAESTRAASRLETVFGTASPNYVLVAAARTGAVNDPANTAAGEALVAEVANEPGIADVISAVDDAGSCPRTPATPGVAQGRQGGPGAAAGRRRGRPAAAAERSPGTTAIGARSC